MQFFLVSRQISSLFPYLYLSSCFFSCCIFLIIITSFLSLFRVSVFVWGKLYTRVSHPTHLDLTNSYLTTLLKLYPTSNLKIQNSYLTAIILDARDQISNFPLITEFLQHPAFPPSPSCHFQCCQIGLQVAD